MGRKADDVLVPTPVAFKEQRVERVKDSRFTAFIRGGEDIQSRADSGDLNRVGEAPDVV